MDKGARWAIVYRVIQSQTQLKWLCMHVDIAFKLLNGILTTDLKSHLLIHTYELSQIQSLWYVFSFENGPYFPVIFALYPGYCNIMLWTFCIWLYSPEEYRHLFVTFFFFFAVYLVALKFLTQSLGQQLKFQFYSFWFSLNCLILSSE